MARVIKRYDNNRKLYDTEAKRYVSLQEIAEMVRSGHDVLVLDNTSGRDLTAQTLAKIIVGGDVGGTALLSNEFLHDLVRWGGRVMNAGMEQLQGGLDRLIQASLQKLAPIQQIRDDMAKLKAQVEKLEALLPELEQARGSASTTKSSDRNGAGSAPYPEFEGPPGSQHECGNGR
jgi:polyhydroxyalkanoate synthesis repressor PhaR